MQSQLPTPTTLKKSGYGAAARQVYTERRVAHWDAVAERMNHWQGLGGYYHQRLAQVYLAAVPPGQRVLELGCAEGDLLAACKPAYGVGIDFSGEMIRRAQVKHPGLHFSKADVHD